jgi:ADP-heptose:LPS heptosyltransferase
LQALAEIEKRSQNWNLKEWICLAPSAAFPLKRWPISHWRNLIQLLPKEKFIILGGPEDHFLKEISKGFENQVHLQMGSCSFQESAAWIQKSKALISNDTGLLHVAEQLGHPTLALMGPAPFGFPSRTQTTTILQKNLDCRPCSKHGQGPCTNPDFHACMQTILPEDVLQTLRSRGLCL